MDPWYSTMWKPDDVNDMIPQATRMQILSRRIRRKLMGRTFKGNDSD